MAYNPNPYHGGYYQPNYYPNSGAMPDMLNQQKMAYQPQMPQQPMQQMATPTSVNDFIWVLSEVEAQSYPVAPNNTVTLWDKNTPTIYIKSANAQSVPTLRILDFTERTENTHKRAETHECNCGDKYVTKEKFNDLRSEIEALKGKINKPVLKKFIEPITAEDYD